MSAPATLRNKTYGRLATALLFLIPVVTFIKIAVETRDRDPLSGSLDVRILQAIHTISTPSLDRLIVHVTNFGGVAAIIFATLIAAVILFIVHKRRAMAILLIGVGGAAIINALLKMSFQRIRPSLWVPIITEKSYSFPSGHAMLSSALALSVILILWKTRWRWIAVTAGTIYIVIIGFSRLYLGVHYPSDVAAGWLVSFVWLLTVKTILTRRQLRAASKEIA